MFHRLARLLSRIRPRKKTFTDDDLHNQEARLQAFQERDYKENDWHNATGGGGG
jgi:hypothetical protein